MPMEASRGTGAAVEQRTEEAMDTPTTPSVHKGSSAGSRAIVSRADDASLLFRGWWRGEEFTHLRLDHPADMQQCPAVLASTRAAARRGICAETSFRFARPSDAAALLLVNRVNPSFATEADFKRSLRAKNEFTLVAEKGGVVVGFAN